MPALVDLLGERFGKLVVVERVAPTTKSTNAHYRCTCDCGQSIVSMSNNLRSGNTSSCGCHKLVCSRGNKYAATHGLSQTPLYTCWRNMLSRCYDPNNECYKTYGGRTKAPVTVCRAWRASVETFVTWALANGYKPGLELDRRENLEGYTPNNCRWITHINNCNNKMNNVTLNLFGQVKTLAQWARDPRCHVTAKVLSRRYALGVKTSAILS